MYETPGGTILVAALRALEALTLDRDTSHEKERLAVRYAELVYFGQWFTPLREGLDAFFASVMDGVTGSVTLKLYRGSAAVCGRRAENSLYDAGPGLLRHVRLHGAGRRGVHSPLRPPEPRPASALAARRGTGGARCREKPVTARRDMWGGRFREEPSPLLSRLNDSLAVDRALLAEDVEGSIAWAQALSRARVLRPAESRRLIAALRRIGRREAPRSGHEDVHSYVEAELRRRVGALAGKLHTGRSRNDQVAVDLRLWLRSAYAEAREGALAVAHRARRARGGRGRHRDAGLHAQPSAPSR